MVLRLLTKLGLEVNLTKSRLLPARGFVFLGVTIVTCSMTIRLTLLRVLATIDAVAEFFSALNFTVRNLLTCIGKLDSVADFVLFGRWMVQFFHWARLWTIGHPSI